MIVSTLSPTAGVAGRAPALVPAPADEILGRAQSSREVIQDFVPLAESLEWQLGQEYLRGRGNKAFISDASPVPFVVNNDGTLSRNAALVLFASLEASSQARGEGEGARGEDDEEIQVLELGIGVGLFARFFLDHFRALCVQYDRDYYDRLCYIAADRSERMLQDVCRHGVLANHAGRYRLRRIDAMEPGRNLAADMALDCRTDWQSVRGAAEQGGAASPDGLPIRPTEGRRPFRAVFLNYLLDCLPAAVLEIDGDEVKQLCVRTMVGRNINLTNYTDLSVEQLRQRAESNDPAARQELLEIYGLFASEYDYRPLINRGEGKGARGEKAAEIPYLDFALDYGRRFSRRLLHSYGAIQSLERLLELVDERGFILVNDYGQTQLTRDDEFEHQRFSLATFVGLNFPLLKAYFEESGGRDQESGVRGQESEVSDQQSAASDSALSTQHSSLATLLGGAARRGWGHPFASPWPQLAAGAAPVIPGAVRQGGPRQAARALREGAGVRQGGAFRAGGRLLSAGARIAAGQLGAVE